MKKTKALITHHSSLPYVAQQLIQKEWKKMLYFGILWLIIFAVAEMANSESDWYFVLMRQSSLHFFLWHVAVFVHFFLVSFIGSVIFAIPEVELWIKHTSGFHPRRGKAFKRILLGFILPNLVLLLLYYLFIQLLFLVVIVYVLIKNI